MSSAMPPKARVPNQNSIERNSSQKARPIKSRSKERRSVGPIGLGHGGIEGSQKNLLARVQGSGDSVHDLNLQKQIESEISRLE